MPEAVVPKADASRGWMLLIYCMLSCSNSAMWVAFAPISDEASIFFGVSNSLINLLAISWSVIYGPGTVLGVWWLSKYKLRDTLILGGMMTVIGGVIRMLAVFCRDIFGAEATYSLVLLGQLLAGVGQPIIVNLATAMASSWFPLEERDRSTTIASIFNPLGNAIGQILPPLLVATTASGDDDDDYRDITGMNMLMLVQFLMALVPVIIAFFYFKERPSSAPSYSEAFRDTARGAMAVGGGSQGSFTGKVAQGQEGRTRSTSVEGGLRDRISRHSAGASSIDGGSAVKLGWEQVLTEGKALWKNKQYLYLLLSFSVGLGLVNSVLTLVFQLVDPYGYSNTDAGLFGFVLILSGLLGAAVMAWVMEHTRAYRTIYSYGFLLCTITVTFFTTMLYHDNFNLLIFSFGLMGMTIVPIFPVCLENTAECTYPISEDISVGVLLTVGNIGTVLITFLLEAMINEPAFGPPPFTPSNLLIVVVLILATSLAFIYKGDNRRLHADQRGTEAFGSGSGGGKREGGASFASSSHNSHDDLQKPLLVADGGTGASSVI